MGQLPSKSKEFKTNNTTNLGSSSNYREQVVNLADLAFGDTTGAIQREGVVPKKTPRPSASLNP